MFTFIEQLQKKPKQTRKRVALGSTAAITFIIFLFWVTSFGSNLPSKQYTPVSPFDTMKNNMASVYQIFKDGISGLEAQQPTSK